MREADSVVSVCEKQDWEPNGTPNLIFSFRVEKAVSLAILVHTQTRTTTTEKEFLTGDTRELSVLA